MATTLRRPAEPAPSRAEQRKQRLLELENEQRIEDAEALKFTDEQRLSLFLSFRSVKFEWSDLDGMRSVRRRYNSPPPVRSPTHSLLQPQVRVTPPQAQADPARPPALPLPLSHSYSSPALAVLTNAHLASFGKDDTICVRRGHSAPQTPAPAPYERYCPTPTPYDSAPSYVESMPFPTTPQRYASMPMSIPACPTGLAPTPGMMARSVSSPPGVSLSGPGVRSSATRSSPSSPSPSSARRSASKSPRTSGCGKRRSPVKGLFSFTGSCASASPSRAAGLVQPIRVPLPPLSLVEGEGDDDDEDDDAWVDEDDDGDTTIVASEGQEEGEEEDDGLQTPVPSSVWRFEASSPPAPAGLRVDVSGLAPPPAYEEEEPATPTPFDREPTPTPFAREEEQGHVGGKRKR